MSVAELGTMFHRSLCTAAGALLIISSATIAVADDPQPGFSWVGHGEGFKLSSEVGTLQLGCPFEDTANKRARLAAFGQHSQAATDPEARAVFPAYAPKLTAWFERWVVGSPGLATWSEARAAYVKAKELTDRAPRSFDAAWIRDHLPDYVAAAGYHATFDPIAVAVENGPCAAAFRAQLGNGNEIAWLLREAREALGRLAAEVRPTLSESNFPRRPTDEPPPTTYWKRMEWIRARVDYLAGVAAMQSAIDAARAVAPFDATIADRVRALEADLAAGHALTPVVVAEIRQTKAPNLKVDATRTRASKKSFVSYSGGSQVGRIGTFPGVAKDSWLEKEEVKRTSTHIYYRQIPTRRETYTVVVAMRPAPGKAKLPTLDGLAVSDVCELYYQQFTRYPKGPRSLSRAWHETNFELIGFLPCSNADQVSALPL